MNPRSDNRHDDPAGADAGSELTLGSDHRAPAPIRDDDKPFNLSMYLDFLPGTD